MSQRRQIELDIVYRQKKLEEQKNQASKIQQHRLEAEKRLQLYEIQIMAQQQPKENQLKEYEQINWQQAEYQDMRAFVGSCNDEDQNQPQDFSSEDQQLWKRLIDLAKVLNISSPQQLLSAIRNQQQACMALKDQERTSMCCRSKERIHVRMQMKLDQSLKPVVDLEF
eukprot:TRINITY_DN3309_c0_g1_i2.p3 TRINITY_DN3309_c0_g1~~TRINITY_DN3309_c0_g1_i2.p3  ORF type:complete len:168 (-),score=23.03 TRINITY_DN3309_c0_g1_i2:266-769(-)